MHRKLNLNLNGLVQSFLSTFVPSFDLNLKLLCLNLPVDMFILLYSSWFSLDYYHCFVPRSQNLDNSNIVSSMF